MKTRHFHFVFGRRHIAPERLSAAEARLLLPMWAEEPKLVQCTGGCTVKALELRSPNQE